jgi:MoaA/NifB/PqqE/SkfB family radical SAM enzyme
MFMRWGKCLKDDPEFSPFGPEIADIEISTICSGVKGVGVCKFCYKSNTPKGTYMPLGTFEKLLEKLPKTVTQIAFGIGDIEANPDMWEIFKTCRLNGIIPNVTVNGEGITDEIADKLSNLCGAVAVSVYDKDKSYDTVKKLTDRGMKQVNIHFMICQETFNKALEVMTDKLLDPRLAKLNAIVLLSLKPKGRAENSGYTRLSQDDFKWLVDYALYNKIGIGFDSCGCGKFVEAVKDSPDFEKFMQLAEPCESGLFSSYFNVEGKFFPCSFAEGTEGWEDGIDIIHSDTELWNHPRVVEWRKRLLGNCRNCPLYNI